MTSTQVIFLITALVTIFSAVMVVGSRKLFHSALWLILSFLGVAASFALLEASFFAIVQLLVYIGAIAILIIFAIMLTRDIMEVERQQINRSWGLVLILVITIFSVLLGLYSTWSGFQTILNPLGTSGQENILAFGKAILAPDGFALPFEASSVLLLAAMIGGIYIAMERKQGGDEA
jgi:NADH-quinone oxidoreductase subunit J